MLNGILLNLIIGYLVKVLLSAEGSINWESVKADMHDALETLIHIPFVEEHVAAALDKLIDLVAAATKDGTDQKTIVENLAGKDFPGAVAALKALLENAATSTLSPSLAQPVVQALRGDFHMMAALPPEPLDKPAAAS